MLKKNNEKKIKNENGFTLVEMMVAMGIIAIIFSLMAYSMLTAGKQTRVRDAAKTLQSNIRTAANNSITVTSNAGDGITPSKAWSIEVTNGGSSYTIADYFVSDPLHPTTLTRYPTDNTTSATITPGSGITFNVINPSGADPKLVFSSPFAKFTSINGSITSWSLDTLNPSSKVLLPQGTMITGSDIKIQVTDGSLSFYVNVNPVTGESSISNN